MVPSSELARESSDIIKRTVDRKRTHTKEKRRKLSREDLYKLLSFRGEVAFSSTGNNLSI